MTTTQKKPNAQAIKDLLLPKNALIDKWSKKDSIRKREKIRASYIATESGTDIAITILDCTRAIGKRTI